MNAAVATTVSGEPASEIGLGAMVMSGYYGSAVEAESRSTILDAVDAGVTWIDTADSYGVGHNEALLGSVIGPVRDKVFLATKFGLVHQGVPGRQLRINGRPEYARTSLTESLRRLDTDWVDLYYLHRIDPDVPVEETVGALGALVEEGLVRHIGICEAEVDEIRRAHATHPLFAVQTEYSLMSREPEREVLPVVRDLGIVFVPYGPVGRGLLAGAITAPDDLGEEDQRRRYPRWQGSALLANLARSERYVGLCRSWDLDPAAVALAWTRRWGQPVVPVPGTRRAPHAVANLGAAALTLGSEELALLEELFAPGSTAGERWPAEGAAVKLPWSAGGSAG